MSNEINTYWQNGKTLYFVQNFNGQIFNNSTGLFEVYNSLNWTDYATVMTSTGNQFYSGSLPAGNINDQIECQIFTQSGSTPATTDQNIAICFYEPPVTSSISGSYKLDINYKDQSGINLQNVDCTIQNASGVNLDTQKSDINGNVSFSIDNGTFEVLSNLSQYTSNVQSVTINGANVNINIVLNLITISPATGNNCNVSYTYVNNGIGTSGAVFNFTMINAPAGETGMIYSGVITVTSGIGGVLTVTLTQGANYSVSGAVNGSINVPYETSAFLEDIIN